MISGETQALVENHFLADDYDEFFGSKKKRAERKAKRKARRLARRLKRNSSAKMQERKQKRRKFFKDVGQVYRDIGGATAIGGVIDAIVMPKDKQTANIPSDLPSDYQFSVGSQASEIVEEKQEQKKGIPTYAYIAGGVVVLGIVTLVILQSNKAKQVQALSQ
ncbi:hypothetical protein U8527_06900 [Kordia algicida OT-1]|uniref:Uncharacterized protein n=1 Tax=Kordia algicida OT-1 TaxID=391587 RepID=A9E9F9_9FLAO|nr:hypothetical protein [Kordia algicida]EDP94668.1 hypothetical protein KAOT1_00290 [Kordia algicida OT-1]